MRVGDTLRGDTLAEEFDIQVSCPNYPHKCLAPRIEIVSIPDERPRWMSRRSFGLARCHNCKIEFPLALHDENGQPVIPTGTPPSGGWFQSQRR